MECQTWKWRREVSIDTCHLHHHNHKWVILRLWVSLSKSLLSSSKPVADSCKVLDEQITLKIRSYILFAACKIFHFIRYTLIYTPQHRSWCGPAGVDRTILSSLAVWLRQAVVHLQDSHICNLQYSIIELSWISTLSIPFPISVACTSCCVVSSTSELHQIAENFSSVPLFVAYSISYFTWDWKFQTNL